MRKRAFAAVFTVCASIHLAGCDSGSEPFTESPLNGAWDAVSVDGQELPVSLAVVIEETSCVITISAIVFNFQGTGRYTGGDTVTRTCSHQPGVTQDLSQTYRGTWRAVGSLLFLKDENGPEMPVSYVLSGNTLTITTEDDGETIVTVLQRR